jgi:hypothetical protein
MNGPSGSFSLIKYSSINNLNNHGNHSMYHTSNNNNLTKVLVANETVI